MSLKDELKQYISNKEHIGAIMLTGSWGCGKTFLINELINEYNEGKEYAVISVSLFGIDSLNNLEKQIKNRIFYLKTNVNSKKKKTNFTALKELTNVLGEHSKVAKGLNTALSINLFDFVKIEKTVECYSLDGKCKKELVLIFDDLERSKLELIEILGVINNYSENSKIKVIVIADEDKIEEEDYKDFKEKVIFNTYKLIPEYDKIMNNVLSEYKETAQNYSEFLRNNADVIKQVFSESKTNNIRILKAILINFERVYKTWIENFGASEYMSDVLYSFAVVSFEFRSGNYTKGEYGYLLSDSKYNEKYPNYNRNRSKLESINEWIATSEWNETYFLLDIKRRYYDDELPDYKNFLFSEFWDLNDDIIFKGIPDCIKMGYDGKLSFDEIIYFLSITSTMKTYNISFPCDIDFKMFLIGLEKRKEGILDGSITEPKSHTFIENNKLTILGQDAVELNKTIEKYKNKIIVWPLRDEFIQSIKDNKFYNMYGKCLESFDDKLLDRFYEEYVKSDNGKRREMSLLLNKLCFDEQQYSTKEDIKLTIQNFNKLKDKLDCIKEEKMDTIALIINKHFIELLDGMIGNLESKI